MQVHLLTAADAPEYRAVRLEVLKHDPLAFMTTAEEFAARSLENVAERLGPTESVRSLGAFLDGRLVGILALVRDMQPVVAHRVNIFGVGVLPHVRGRGVGDVLLREAIAQAESWPGVQGLFLGVVETQHTARRLYERHGFECWGRQPQALYRDGQFYAEDWLWRRVGPGARG